MSSELKDNTQKSRYELEVDGHVAFANYRIDGDKFYINYVEAPVELRGTGAAGKLMQLMMDKLKTENKKVVPICGYAVAWIRKHKEYHDTLA